MSVFRRKQRSSDPEEIKQSIERDDKQLLKKPNDIQVHLKKGLDLINMSLAVEFPFDREKLINKSKEESERFENFSLENSFLLKAVQEFDWIINSDKSNLKYRAAKIDALRLLIFQFYLINKVYNIQITGCLVYDQPERNVIPPQIVSFVENSMMEEFNNLINMEISEVKKIEYISEMIDFYSSAVGKEIAIRKIDHYIEDYPSFSKLHYIKAMLLIDPLLFKNPVNVRSRNESLEESLQECNLAIGKEGGNPAYHLLRGYLLKALNKPDEGEIEIEYANRIGLKDKTYKLNKIEIEMSLGEIESEDQNFEDFQIDDLIDSILKKNDGN